MSGYGHSFLMVSTSGQHIHVKNTMAMNRFSNTSI